MTHPFISNSTLISPLPHTFNDDIEHVYIKDIVLKQPDHVIHPGAEAWFNKITGVKQTLVIYSDESEMYGYMRVKNPYQDKSITVSDSLIDKMKTLPNHILDPFLKLCKWLDSHFGDNVKPDIPLDHMGAFRQYVHMDKELISLFAEQNNMGFKVEQVDSYIEKANRPEIMGVAHTINNNSAQPDTQLGDLPPELITKIFSFVQINDVVLNPDISHNVENMGDLSLPNNDYE